MYDKRLRGLTNKKLRAELKSKKDKNYVFSLLTEGLDRYFYYDAIGLDKVLNPLFSTNRAEDIKTNMQLLDKYIKLQNAGLEQKIGHNYCGFSQSISLDYFNPLYKLNDDKLLRVCNIALLSSNSYNTRIRDKYLTLGLAAAAQLDDFYVFSSIINSFDEFKLNNNFDFIKVREYAIRADYLKNNLYQYYDKEVFLTGQAVEMLHSKDVIDMLNF